MRILHVITSLRTGGAERLMLDLLPRLKEKGQDVELCVFDGTRTQFYEKMEKAGVPINTLQIGGNVYNPLNIIRLLRVIRKGKVRYRTYTSYGPSVLYCNCKFIS